MSAHKQIVNIVGGLKIKVKYHAQCYIKNIIYHINKTLSAGFSFHTKDSGTLALITTVRQQRKSLFKVQGESQDAKLANFETTQSSTHLARQAP